RCNPHRRRRGYAWATGYRGPPRGWNFAPPIGPSRDGGPRFMGASRIGDACCPRDDTPPMSRTHATAVRFALPIPALAACGAGLLMSRQAHAAQGTFQVRVHVVNPAHDASAALDRLPMPSGAQRLSRTRGGDSYWCDGAPIEVAGRYRQTLSAQGYRLA